MMQVRVSYDARHHKKLSPQVSRISIVLSDGSEFALWETERGLFVYTPESTLEVASTSSKGITLIGGLP